MIIHIWCWLNKKSKLWCNIHESFTLAMRVSIFLFWTSRLSPLSIAINTLAIFVGSMVLSSCLYHPLCMSLVWPRWLVTHVNSDSVISKSCKIVDRYFLVLVGVNNLGLISSIFFVIPWMVSHPRNRFLPSPQAKRKLLFLSVYVERLEPTNSFIAVTVSSVNMTGTNPLIWEPD